MVVGVLSVLVLVFSGGAASIMVGDVGIDVGTGVVPRAGDDICVDAMTWRRCDCSFNMPVPGA